MQNVIVERISGGGAPNFKPNFAFTLAEVLITLGIIGIVAAMTLPLLTAKYQKVVAANQLKRLYSMLSNAQLRAQKDYGDVSNWDYPIVDENLNRVISNDDFLKKYYLPYLKTSKVNEKVVNLYKVTNFNGQDVGYDRNHISRGSFFRLSDGTCITLASNNQYVVLSADLNCEKIPNRLGRDVFDVGVLYTGNRQFAKLSVPWISDIYSKDTVDRDFAIERCKNFSYIVGTPEWCFTLFVYDGWQFKEDYPW